MVRKILTISVFVFYFLTGFQAVAGAQSISFDSFVDKVLASYPALKGAASNVDIALARKMQASAGFWPSLNISAGYRVSDDPVDVFGMLLRQERFTSSDFDLKRLNTPRRHQDFSAGLHLELPLFDALQTINRTRAASAMVKSAESQRALAVMEALLVAYDAYVNAGTLERLAVLANEVEQSAAQDLEQAKALKDKGMILGADYFSARVAAGNFIHMKNELVRQRQAMGALLNILMGEPWDQPCAVTTVLQENLRVSEDGQKMVMEGLRQRPDVQALEAELDSVQADLSRSKSDLLPRLSVFGHATNDRNKLASDGGNNFTAGLKAEMPLFDPGHAGRVKEAGARKTNLEENLSALKDAVKRDMTQEISRRETLRDNAAVLKNMMADAREAVTLTVPLYSEGRKSIADLLQMRRVYLETAAAYEKALTGVWLSEARLLFLKGQLTSEGLKALSREAGL